MKCGRISYERDARESYQNRILRKVLKPDSVAFAPIREEDIKELSMP